MKKKKVRKHCILYADFETTIDSLDKSEVWSAASIRSTDPLLPEFVDVRTNIDDFMEYLFNIPYDDVEVYFHNLKFDGAFMLYYLEASRRFRPFLNKEGLLDNQTPPIKMAVNTYRYLISDMSQWYKLEIRLKNDKIITIKDSLKLLPVSLKKLGIGFKTKYQKLEMPYSNHVVGETISESDLAYIRNDVLVLKESMETAANLGLSGITIGSVCMRTFRSNYEKKDYEAKFPDLLNIALPNSPIDPDDTERNVDSFIRRSYHGGWCYCNPRYQGRVLGHCIHVDANSHYPSQMHSSSGNFYPIGTPEYFTGEKFNKYRNQKTKTGYYFVHFRCKFKIRPNKYPMVQIKDDYRFRKKRNEWLMSSENLLVDLVMSQVDFQRFEKTYEITDLSIIEFLNFKTVSGLFDKYIEEWYRVKETSTGAMRQISKLYLNNLYGKFGASNNSSYKMARIEDKKLKYTVIPEYEKKTGYIAIGAAVTSYCRNKTIGYAEDIYDDFVYSDTDSIVSCGNVEDLTMPIHPTRLGYWDIESKPEKAIFAHQKAYVEVIEGSYNVKCAGMGSIAQRSYKEALEEGREALEGFKSGLSVQGNLKSRNVEGGVLLVEQTFVMK